MLEFSSFHPSCTFNHSFFGLKEALAVGFQAICAYDFSAPMTTSAKHNRAVALAAAVQLLVEQETASHLANILWRYSLQVLEDAGILGESQQEGRADCSLQEVPLLLAPLRALFGGLAARHREWLSFMAKCDVRFFRFVKHHKFVGR